MKKKYLLRLTSEERQRLMELVRKGKVTAYRRTHARILLWVDEGAHGPGLPDGEAAERVGVNERTVSRLRERCVINCVCIRFGNTPWFGQRFD